MPAAALMTADEYIAQANAGEGTRGAELIDGVVVVDEPLVTHQHALVQILTALRQWTTEGPDRGEATLPLDVRLDERNVFGPDMMWFPASLVSELIDRRPYPLPSIAVEVRSPSTWRYDIGTKKSRYEQAGLPELWLVDTVAMAIVGFRRSRPDAPTFDVSFELTIDESLTSPQLPGFALPLRDVFRVQ